MAMDPVRKIYLERERVLCEQIKQYSAPTPFRFRASELGNCYLRMWFRLAGYIPAARDPRGDDYGRDGDLHHDQVRKFLREAGVKLSGVKFKKDGTVEETAAHVIPVQTRHGQVEISMRLDGFIYIGNKKYVLEIKSVGEGKLRYLLRSWEESGDPTCVAVHIAENQLGYHYQSHACMKGAKVPRTYLLFKDRSGCAVGLHSKKDKHQIIGGPTLEFNKLVWDTITRKLGTLRKALDDETPPAPTHTVHSQVAECKYYCEFAHLCYVGERRKRQGKKIKHPQLGKKLHVGDL